MMDLQKIQRQRKALDWLEAHYGETDLVRYWKRYINEQQQLLEEDDA